MPKRSNAYQKLVLMISRHLSHLDSVVTESKMLWDHEAEQDREVDICIEQQVGTFSIIVGIECTNLSRPVDLPRVQAFYVKHRNIGINKTIIVSKSGFTASAKVYAQKKKMELLTFGGAMRRSWPSYMNKLQSMTLVHYEAKVHSLKYSVVPEATGATFTPSLRNKVDVDGEWVCIGDYAHSLFRRGRYGSLANIPKEDLSERGSGFFEDSWELTPPIHVVDEYGVRGVCSDIAVQFEVSLSEKPIALKYDRYGGSDVAYGNSGEFGPFKNADVVVSSDSSCGDPENPKFAITINIDTENGL